jgi:nicotinate-nucleotide pyrophosphorylase (carboxylating)
VSRAVHPPRVVVVDAVTRALTEDLVPLGDLTSALLPDDLTATATFVARQPGIVAGRACVAETFRQIDESVELDWALDDGDPVAVGGTIAEARGVLASILTAERTALNFLGHLSGIATRTRAFVDAAAVRGPTRIWDTRKTTPGLRTLEKAAVRAGGGANHRGNLSDWILLKDNHIALFGITDAVERARSMWPGRTVHVECDRLDQVVEALECRADALLLDNMTPELVVECVAAATTSDRRPLLEVSGGVTLDTVGAYAATGVDCISIGGLTNAAPVLDIGLDIDPV